MFYVELNEKYHELQWQLELSMFEFVQEKKCELAKLKYMYVRNKYEKIYFSSNDVKALTSNAFLNSEAKFSIRIPFHISSILKLVSLIVKHALSGGIIS
jgi:hypothetical protein